MLIRAFEFESTVPSDDIIKKAEMVQQPLVKESDLKSGTQMPLIPVYCDHRQGRTIAHSGATSLLYAAYWSVVRSLRRPTPGRIFRV